MFDFVIRGGMVLDGTAAPAFRADVGLSGGQVTAQMAGSDGIYRGGHPHPRGWGAFARLLGRHVFVNGIEVLSGGALTPAARSTPPGRVLRPG
jgi:hypothetical protein